MLDKDAVCHQFYNLHSKYLTKEALEGFRLQIRTSNTQHETDDLLLNRKKW